MYLALCLHQKISNTCELQDDPIIQGYDSLVDYLLQSMSHLPMFYFFTSMPYTLLCIYTSVLWITLDQKLKCRGMLYRKTQNRTEETYFLIDGQQFTCVI